MLLDLTTLHAHHPLTTAVLHGTAARAPRVPRPADRLGSGPSYSTPRRRTWLTLRTPRPCRRSSS